MEATVKTKELNEALDKVKLAIQSGSNLSLPLIGCVRIVARQNAIRLHGTNFDLFIGCAFDNEVVEEGEAIVNFALFNAFCSKAQDSKLILWIEENELVVEDGSTVARFGLFRDSWPQLEEDSAGEFFDGSGEDFVGPLALVEHAISSNQARMNLTGVNIHRNETLTEFVAIDGSRIAMSKSPLPFAKADILLPKEAVRAIVALVGKESMRIRVHSNSFSIYQGDLSIASRLIDATFPNYVSLIEKPSSKGFSANRKELIEIVNRASLFIERGQTAVVLTGNGKDNVLKISCGNKFKAKLIGTELAKQADKEIHLNAQYLMDALDSCKDENVRLEFGSNGGVSNTVCIQEVDFFEVIACINPAIAKPVEEKKPF